MGVKHERAWVITSKPLFSVILQADGRDRTERVRPPDWDWAGLRVALESMQSELLELRGALQQGL